MIFLIFLNIFVRHLANFGDKSVILIPTIKTVNMTKNPSGFFCFPKIAKYIGAQTEMTP